MALAHAGTDFSQRIRRAATSPLFLAVVALWLLLAGMEIARPGFFLHDDNATWFVGAYAHDFRVLTQTGRLAEVDYFQYGGEPFIEQGQTAVLYPPVYLAAALASATSDLRAIIEWLAAIHLTLGLIGSYFWLRAGGVSAHLAALGGLAWVLNPFVLIVASSWIMVTYAVAWTPWLFYALDRVLTRPSRTSALALGAIAGLFFLQGYVQWTIYAFLFLAAYALFRFFAPRHHGTTIRRAAVLYYLLIAAVVFLILALPLILPMSHAAAVSKARAHPLDVGHSLFFRVAHGDLLRAELGLFHPRYIFNLTSAILYCPALWLLPLAVLRFVRAGAAIRQKLFPMLLLAAFAIFLSSRWHVFLSFLPVTDEFRWPFKMFLFADFFAIAAFIWTLASWEKSRSLIAITCVSVLIAAELAISLGCHDGNFYSDAKPPTAQRPLPASVDPTLGRVIAIAADVPQPENARFLMLGHGTFYEMPSLGGYNPLVSPERLAYGLGLDFPNLYRGPFTPELRAQLQSRAVRYWIVDPRSPQFAEIASLPGIRVLATEADRAVLEDQDAAPLATDAAGKSCAITYAGNSLRIAVAGAASPIQVSVGPTDGWWTRIDNGPWTQPPYNDYRLAVSFPPNSQTVEVSYFDPRFDQGLEWSAILSALLVVLIAASRRISYITPTTT